MVVLTFSVLKTKSHLAMRKRIQTRSAVSQRALSVQETIFTGPRKNHSMTFTVSRFWANMNLRVMKSVQTLLRTGQNQIMKPMRLREITNSLRIDWISPPLRVTILTTCLMMRRRGDWARAMDLSGTDVFVGQLEQA